MSLSEEPKQDKLTQLIDEGPKNKLLRYFVYYPLMVAIGLFLIFGLSYALAEGFAWLFGIGVILVILIWPIKLIYKWLIRNKEGSY